MSEVLALAVDGNQLNKRVDAVPADLARHNDNNSNNSNNSSSNNNNNDDDDNVDDLVNDKRLKEEHDRLVAKYGKSLSKQMLKKKLSNKRRFFDSADYFRRLEGGEELLLEDGERPPVLFCFKRSTDGALHAEENLHAKQTAKELLEKSQRKGRHYFDSADYALKLQGLLEYPLGEKPYPISFFFNRDRVGVVSHPDGTAVPPESVREMCEAADEALRQRYGDKLTASKLLRLKLRAKKKKFDSADWALQLAGELPQE